MVIVGENLLGAVTSRAAPSTSTPFERKVDRDVQAVFEQVQILVARSQQGLDIRADFNTLLHSGGQFLFSCTLRQVGLCGGHQSCRLYIKPILEPEIRRLSALNKRLIPGRWGTDRNAGLEVQATTIAFKPTPVLVRVNGGTMVGKLRLIGPASDQWCDIARWKSSAVVT